MKPHHKHINKIGRIVVDSLLLVLLWTLLALPASTFSLLRVTPQDDNQVLSGQDARKTPRIDPEDKTKSYREPTVNNNLDVEESTPSETLTP